MFMNDTWMIRSEFWKRRIPSMLRNIANSCHRYAWYFSSWIHHEWSAKTIPRS